MIGVINVQLHFSSFLEITLHTIYDGRPIHTMFFDKLNETICVSDIVYKEKKLKPEKIMRRVPIFYRDFIKLHNYLEETLSIYEVWQTPLTTSFTVKGGWAFPKAQLVSAKITVASLQNYARWFWPLTDEWVMACEITQNEVNDVVMKETMTEYTGMCTMNVVLSIQRNENGFVFF